MDNELDHTSQSYSPEMMGSLKGVNIPVSPDRANQTHYKPGPGIHMSQIPIKQRLKNMEENLSEQKKQLNQNKKETQVLRSDCYQMQHKNKEFCNEMLKQELLEIGELEKDFKKAAGIDNTEVSFLKQQLSQLTQQKTKLQQSVVVLSTRVNNMEQELGYEDQTH